MAKAKNAPKSKAPGKSKAQSKPAAPAPAIDPAQSAALAAAMVAHKVTAPGAPDASLAQSSSFKQLKEALNRPHAQTMGNLLDKISSTSSKTSAVPFPRGKQVGHNQTFGADATRRGVPRRTGG